jgi:predicted nucleic acid-binding protein
MIVVVADTSPIHYLIQIQAIDVLARLFEQVVIPKSVEEELLNLSAPHEVRQWMLHPPAYATVKSALRVLPLNLDPGETEAIALAKELDAFAVLLDDGEARQVAKREGLQVTGTIGLLEKAAAAGLVDLPSVFARLKATTYYASPELLEAALARDLARKREKP